MAAARPRRRKRPLLRAFFHSYRLVLGTTASLLFFALAVHLGCRNTAPPVAQQPIENATPIIRVRLEQDATTMKLTASAGAQPILARTGNSPPLRLNLPPKTPVSVTLLSNNTWRIGSRDLGGVPGEMTIEADPAGSLSIEGRAYRGALHFVPTKGTSFDVVNHLTIDDYLMGVLPGELYAEFHLEAYKAQAVIARTYAIYSARTAPTGRHWDVHDDVRSQMYVGMKGESGKSREAVRATAGTVVAYGPPGNLKIFKAYYSSCCGGATVSAADVFGEPSASFEPFTERAVGRRCDITAGRYRAKFDWTIAMTRDELTRRLKLWGRRNGHALRNMEALRRLDVFKLNAAGRPTAFAIEDGRGQRYVIGAEQLRLAVNTDAPEASKLFSSFVTPTIDGSTVRFAGRGHGHGVGMCQWCLEALARQGFTYDRIVLDAYKGATLIPNAYKHGGVSAE